MAQAWQAPPAGPPAVRGEHRLGVVDADEVVVLGVPQEEGHRAAARIRHRVEVVDGELRPLQDREAGPARGGDRKSGTQQGQQPIVVGQNVIQSDWTPSRHAHSAVALRQTYEFNTEMEAPRRGPEGADGELGGGLGDPGLVAADQLQHHLLQGGERRVRHDGGDLAGWGTGGQRWAVGGGLTGSLVRTRTISCTCLCMLYNTMYSKRVHVYCTMYSVCVDGC